MWEDGHPSVVAIGCSSPLPFSQLVFHFHPTVPHLPFVYFRFIPFSLHASAFSTPFIVGAVWHIKMLVQLLLHYAVVEPTVVRMFRSMVCE